MAGQRIQVPPVVLDVLAVVALRTGQPEHPLLQDRVDPVPQRQPQAQVMVNVGQPRHAVLVPPVRPGPGMIMRKILPRVTVVAVVLPNRAPGPLRQVRPPLVPGIRLEQVVLRRARWPRPAGHAQRSHPEVPRAASSCRRSWGPPKEAVPAEPLKTCPDGGPRPGPPTLYDAMRRAGCALWHDDSRRRTALVAPEQQFTFRSRRVWSAHHQRSPRPAGDCPEPVAELTASEIHPKTAQR